MGLQESGVTNHASVNASEHCRAEELILHSGQQGNCFDFLNPFFSVLLLDSCHPHMIFFICCFKIEMNNINDFSRATMSIWIWFSNTYRKQCIALPDKSQSKSNTCRCCLSKLVENLIFFLLSFFLSFFRSRCCCCLFVCLFVCLFFFC